MATLAAGTLLGDRYEILRAIKSGGMGAVYEARDRRLADSRCAVKQLLDHDADDEAVTLLRRKFDEEMQFLASLSHPGIPRLRDFFSDGQRQFLVMDLVEGVSLDEELDQAVREGRGLPPERVVDDAIDLLDILVYLHGRKPPVVHRDIKPANIIRETDGRLKLLDFGIARLHEGRSTTHTQLGTLCYAPLEQIQGHAEPRSDVYAVGATMHHLISGVESPALAIPPLQRVAPGVDPDLAAIVNRAVAAAPVDRYDDALAMRAALVEWRNRHQGGAATAQLPHDASGTRPLMRASSPTALASARETAALAPEASSTVPLGLLVLGIAVVLAFVVWLLAPRPTPTTAASPTPTPVVAATVERGSPMVLTGSAAPSPEVRASPAGPRIAYATPTHRPTPAAATSRPAPSPAQRPTVAVTPVAARPSPPVVAATPASTPPPPPPAAAPTPLPAAYSEVLPPVAPAPPAPRPDRPPGPPGPGGAEGGPPRGLADYDPAVPPGWQAVLLHATETPPRKDFELTSAIAPQAHIRLSVWMMPQPMLATAVRTFLSDAQRDQWRVGPPVVSGGLESFSLERPGGVGLLEVRAEGVMGEHVRLFAATVTASNAAELAQARRVVEEHLLR